ncbi:DeoR/GlpR family DNA-binding transcription regulator [Thalassoroseus pseudoceratinae]|uniref:DeoR/GlpR family DNA-binding transcription regulator n=1 Tax=Thalassoroseus pseudoceratinae TaxID=2713176 RepID=UPI00141E99CF|nr:DeoR/GlpR family DNA-binding transcription regulator [Thalassoroseus pseudoceratinae]
MLVDQRRQQILKVVENKGFVSLQELSELCDASESTVRRDLEHLDSCGTIRRTRGGAAFTGESLATFDDREKQASNEKYAIARFIAAQIEPNETVLLDGGTTTLEVARQLIGKEIQVVTNSLPIVSLLSNHPGIELVIIGGYLYPKTGVCLGPIAIDGLKGISARRLIMSTGGITEKGLFNSNVLLVETERQMMSVADEIIVAADSTKFGHSELTHLCELSEVNKIVTDSHVRAPWKKTCEQSDVELVIVDA